MFLIKFSEQAYIFPLPTLLQKHSVEESCIYAKTPRLGRREISERNGGQQREGSKKWEEQPASISADASHFHMHKHK